jgi:hypothetical protein
MIFSVWNPDGGYDYFESKMRHGIGDDLPEVSMPPTVNNIGVPAQDVGRPVPRDAVAAGRGVIPIGVMAPMARPYIGISGIPEKETFYVLGVFLGAAAFGFFLSRGRK